MQFYAAKIFYKDQLTSGIFFNLDKTESMAPAKSNMSQSN